MKTMLSRFFNQYTLVVNNLILKTLTQWLNELSHAFHFLLSYWQPAYSYGQTSTAAAMQFNSKLQSKQRCLAFQDLQSTQTASLRKRKTNSLSASLKSKKLSGLKESLHLEGFLIRLFNGLYTFWENKRLRWGMFFLLIFAPASKFFYLALPEFGFGEYLVNAGPIQILNTIEMVEGGWYYATFYMYFFSIGELLGPVLSIMGIFFLFPKKYYPSYLIGVPFGYYLSMLIHRMFFVSDYESFHSGTTTTMTFAFLILGIVFFVVSDKVLFRQNHIKRAAEARIVGLINMPGMEWNDKEEIIKKEVAQVMKVDNELFIKESA